jgi:hypothetical protein
MLVARRLTRFVVSSARIGSIEFFHELSWYPSSVRNEPTRFINEPARELKELSQSSKTKLYAYHLRNN